MKLKKYRNNLYLVQMPRSTRRRRIEEVRSSSESPERRTRRVDSSPQSPAQRRAATPPRTQYEHTPRAVEQPAAVTTLSVEDVREAVAAELARAQTADTAGVASNANGAVRRRGRGQARGWGRGRWINFGCYLPHPGPYTPFCRAHREAGCSICMYFCPNQTYINPQENNWAIEY